MSGEQYQGPSRARMWWDDRWKKVIFPSLMGLLHLLLSPIMAVVELIRWWQSPGGKGARDTGTRAVLALGRPMFGGVLGALLGAGVVLMGFGTVMGGPSFPPLTNWASNLIPGLTGGTSIPSIIMAALLVAAFSLVGKAVGFLLGGISGAHAAQNLTREPTKITVSLLRGVPTAFLGPTTGNPIAKKYWPKHQGGTASVNLEEHKPQWREPSQHEPDPTTTVEHATTDATKNAGDIQGLMERVRSSSSTSPHASDAEGPRTGAADAPTDEGADSHTTPSSSPSHSQDE